MKDYYSILGLDPDASPRSVKVAYRRLARESHPDRLSHLGSKEVEQASVRMAELNEAYEVLSDSRQRREYDVEYRVHIAPPVPEPVETPEIEQEILPKAAPIRPRARPGADVLSGAVQEFSLQIKTDLMRKQKAFNWQEKRFEGFEWTFAANFPLSRYWVALRGFSAADRTAAQKFTNYANLAIDENKSWLRANYFLFLLSFQRIAEPEQVMSVCRWFSQTTGRSTLHRIETLVALLDASHGRVVLCGPVPKDERLGKLLQTFRRTGS